MILWQIYCFSITHITSRIVEPLTFTCLQTVSLRVRQTLKRAPYQPLRHRRRRSLATAAKRRKRRRRRRWRRRAGGGGEQEEEEEDEEKEEDDEEERRRSSLKQEPHTKDVGNEKKGNNSKI